MTDHERGDVEYGQGAEKQQGQGAEGQRGQQREGMVDRVVAWYEEHQRDLPWRADGATPWGVLVSEFMLQQTPVRRVLPVWEQWMETWPTPGDLAGAAAGDAVRAWGRLGYPRRALRLHATATTIVAEHGGRVPTSYDELLSLPGVGDYTAAAVSAFAFRQRRAVLDTNVRRVLARATEGIEFPGASPTRAERARAEDLLPDDPPTAATWSVAVMELGALVCTTERPACTRCPIEKDCAWVRAGRPAHDGPPRRGQAWAGTDRMVRGRLMAVVREAPGSVPRARLEAAWDDSAQLDRCLASLLEDGLLVELSGRYGLPGAAGVTPSSGR